MSLLVMLALATAPTTAEPPARCTVQQVHTPAGKLVHNAPIVRCERQIARQVERRPTQNAGGPERAAR